ncbi:hypothetical protein GW17_00019264 [Ensete ventricosum]|nr:hypothetical protein GW17_00019264 [Ensete ventricosum]
MMPSDAFSSAVPVREVIIWTRGTLRILMIRIVLLCTPRSVVIDLEGLRRRKRSSLVVEGLVPDGSRGYHDGRGWSSEIRLCAYRLEMVFERSYILFECMCACSFRLFVDNVENTMLDFYG